METTPLQVEMACPSCRALCHTSFGGTQVTCPSCHKQYETLYMRRPEPRARAGSGMGPCSNHPGNVATGSCRQCHAWMCDVCAFRVGTAKLCPNCATAGPTAATRSASFVKSVLSVLCAFGATAVFVVLNVQAASRGVQRQTQEDAIMAMVVGAAALLLVELGVVWGFASRDQARGRSAPLAIIGIVLNLLLLGLLTLAAVV